jgi:hypothetical protein
MTNGDGANQIVFEWGRRRPSQQSRATFPQYEGLSQNIAYGFFCSTTINRRHIDSDNDVIVASIFAIIAVASCANANLRASSKWARARSSRLTAL